MIVKDNITKRILFDPLINDVNELYICTAYATPTMLSWYIKNIYQKTICPIKISLIIGMVPIYGISQNAHENFLNILNDKRPQEIEKLECSYICDGPAVHSNIYIWAKNENPKFAFTGSASFVQNSFVGLHRQEFMVECDPIQTKNYYDSLVSRSIYINHSELEENVKLYSINPFLNNKEVSVSELEKEGEYVTLSLLTNSGETGKRSGLNWGQRPHRNPNEAYIPLPSIIAKSGFFPLEKKHFAAITDDRHQLILRIEQQNNKAITTPARNSDLGEYFRNRLGLANGDFISRSDLDRYGRTDVKFIKFDEETYYLDFSI